MEELLNLNLNCNYNCSDCSDCGDCGDCNPVGYNGEDLG